MGVDRDIEYFVFLLIVKWVLRKRDPFFFFLSPLSYAFTVLLGILSVFFLKMLGLGGNCLLCLV